MTIDTAVLAGMTDPAPRAYERSGLCKRVHGSYWSLGLLGSKRIAVCGGRMVDLDSEDILGLAVAWGRLAA